MIGWKLGLLQQIVNVKEKSLKEIEKIFDDQNFKTLIISVNTRTLIKRSNFIADTEIWQIKLTTFSLAEA